MNKTLKKDFDLCECGHIRRSHYNNIGSCNEIRYLDFYNGFNKKVHKPCSCKRFKKQRIKK